MKKEVKKKYIEVKIVYLIVLYLFLGLSVQSQNITDRWAFSIGAGGVLYSEKDLRSIGYQYSEQFPRFSIARYMFKNVTFAGSFSQSIDDNKKYLTFDSEIRYDFGTSENLINIYALVGGSLIDTNYLLPLVNFGAGGTLWIFQNVGLQGQLIYKYNNSGFQSQASHIFGSGGIVYCFAIGGENKYSTRGRKKKRTRLWEMKH